ncbi:hypothetical protein [Phycicoccus avicenniae]|uniref:hypothetical protein n=1 Tax=Phycicoccus avicenniae TaxID=2828860 RepID=UPI003D2DF070
MSGTLRGRAARAAALVLLAGAAACSGAADDASPAGSTGRATSASSAPATGSSASPSPSAAAPSRTAPAGTTLVRAQRSRMTFAVPTSWQVTDVTTLLSSGDEKALAGLAEQLNLSLSQVRAAARTIDVAAFGPSVDGFAPNVNVQLLPVEEPPSAAQLRLAMSAVGGTVESVEDVTTTFGPGRVSSYRLELGGRTVVGRQLGIKAPGGVALVTVSHVTAKEADVVLALVKGSLTAD